MRLTTLLIVSMLLLLCPQPAHAQTWHYPPPPPPPKMRSPASVGVGVTLSVLGGLGLAHGLLMLGLVAEHADPGASAPIWGTLITAGGGLSGLGTSLIIYGAPHEPSSRGVTLTVRF